MQSLPLLIILYAGLTHAFEADHLLAVSNIVSQRKSTVLAIKDGLFWGLGHTSTIMCIGILMIVFKMNIAAHAFSYFEALVGLVLIVVAVYRLRKFFRTREVAVHHHPHLHAGENVHTHVHLPLDATQRNLHKASYGIGLVHGLAGSGELVVMAMTQFRTPLSGVLYLLLFATGCIGGMFIAAGLFSIPFSRKIMDAAWLRTVLILVSSGLCLAYGFYAIYKNIWL